MQQHATASFETRLNPAQPIRISVAALGYLALFCFALVLRLAEIDTVPIMPAETHNALAAWREIMPNAPGVPLISTSPLLFATQSISFSLLGASELTARLGTVLAGALLVLSPILFRSLLGGTRAFLLSVFLAFSPVLLAASRSSSPDVWALLFAVLSLWACWQAFTRSRYATFAIIMFTALMFLVGTSGLILGIILLLAGAVTLLWRRTVVPTEADELALTGSTEALRASLKWALPIALLVVFVVSTGFMLFPAGLSSVGEVVGGAVRAITQPAGLGGYAALVALFYEPALWLFALVSLIIRRDRLTSLDIFLAAWVILAIVATLLFADSSPDHALWLTVPLAVMSVNALVRVFAPDDDITFLAAPRWARWVIAASLIGMLCVFTLSFQSLARSFLATPGGELSAVAPDSTSVILLLVSILFLIIGFFLFASLWGNRTTWQGIGMGTAAFLLVTSLGSGWNASVTQAQNPAEFWHMHATHSDTALMRETLFDVADRISRAFPVMPLKVMAPQDGIVAWVLRDFSQAEYISDINDARGVEVAILPATLDDAAWGEGYVGQDFTVSRAWDLSTLNVIDIPALWTQRRARFPRTAEDRVVLWLRLDVYQGTSSQSEVG